MNPRIALVTVSIIRDAANTTIKPNITRPQDCFDLLTTTRNADREHFVCIHLNARNQVISMETVAIGTLNSAQIHPREVFKAAILANAASIILAHNHPSNDVTPSREDIELTRRMVQAGDIMGIEVLDHIIVTPDKYLSMKERNLF